jgi:hypothetical protein
MDQELPDRVLGELSFTNDVGLCLHCTSRRLGINRWDVMQAIRYLMASGSIDSLVTTCAGCGEEQHVVRARQDRWT